MEDAHDPSLTGGGENLGPPSASGIANRADRAENDT